MGKYSNTKTKTGTPLIGILLGVGIAIIISLLLTWLQTSLTLRGSIPLENAGIFTFIIRTVSVFAGSLIGTVITEGKGLSVIGIITGIYLFLLIVLGILLYDGLFHGLLLGVVSVLIGGILVVLIKLKPQKRRKYSVRSAR